MIPMSDQTYLVYEALHEVADELRTANKIAYMEQLNRFGSRGDWLDIEIRKELGLEHDGG